MEYLYLAISQIHAVKNFGFVLLLLVLFASCSKDEDPIERAVVDTDETTRFEELLLLIKPRLNDSTFLLVTRIDSVKILVNNSFWATQNSVVVDTSKFTRSHVGNMTVTPSPVAYMVSSSQQKDASGLNTAGEVSDYLNSNLDLKPGDYLAFVESFRITLNDNSVRTIYPMLYTRFTVVDNTRSALADELIVNID